MSIIAICVWIIDVTDYVNKDTSDELNNDCSVFIQLICVIMLISCMFSVWNYLNARFNWLFVDSGQQFHECVYIFVC